MKIEDRSLKIEEQHNEIKKSHFKGDLEGLHKEIKQSLRLLMNGVTAQSLREKGMDYHLNWGANLLHLREMANNYEPSKELAELLWNDDIRECKILATILMPSKDFTYDLAKTWISNTHTQEIAEIASKYLYSKLPYAKDLAFRLLDESSDISMLHAFCILGTLNNLSEDEINRATIKAKATIDDLTLPMGVRHVAYNMLSRIK